MIPSILYSIVTAEPAIVPAVAAIVMLPSLISQSEGLTTVANASKLGAVGPINSSGLVVEATTQVLFS